MRVSVRDGLSNEAFWNERYRGPAPVWSGEPNARLVEETSALTPGTALDAGCGEGADAIWLAERGWRVTAIDIATTALDRARAVEMPPLIAERIVWQQGDLVANPPQAATFDLVSSHFMQMAPDMLAAFVRGIAAAVKPGGTLLIVGHHPSDLLTTARRPRAPGVLYAAEDVTALLDPNEWDVVVCAAQPRPATDPDNNPVTVHDTVLRAQRLRSGGL
jgi:SAM-dependent methyltransferase